MSTLVSTPYALGIGALVAIVAGCGGSQSQVGVPDAMPQGALGQAVPARPLDGQLRPPAGGIKDIYDFKGSPDGQQPEGSFSSSVKIPATGLGTTARGGDASNDGTVYGLTKGSKGSWTESVLYTFRGYAYGDGSEPASDVIEYKDGEDAVFVSAVSGGTSNNGALVKLTPISSGFLTESFIYSFGGSPDGANPWGAVVADKAGNLYGTTESGGAYYGGTVYRMQPNGSSYTESVLYSFGTNPYDGASPIAGLTIDKNGALYGTTEAGGSAGYGTVFKLTPSGSGYTESILHSFQGYSDGTEPTQPPVSCNPKPEVCGVTAYGGANGDGVIYRLNPSGSGYTVLWTFGSVSGDGQIPRGICVNKKGVIYGTTLGGGYGGSSGLGTFYTLTPSGSTYKERVYSFTGANGAYPWAGPSIDKKGHIYVTASQGGANNKGAVVTLKTVAATYSCSS